MSENTHPSYPKPTIREALCEVRFPGDVAKFSSQVAQFWLQAQETFTGLEAHVDYFLPVADTGNVPLLVGSPPPPRARFLLRHSIRSVIVQAVAGAITINVPAPYLGWATMEQDVRDVWQMAIQAFQPSRVSGIVLRYIDRVPQPPHLIGDDGWLMPGDYLPAAILRATPPFFSRVQTGQGTNNVTSVTVSHEYPTGGQTTAMLVDFERTVTEEVDVNAGVVLERVNGLHEDIWQLFKSVKGPLWNDQLEGKTHE